MTWDELEPGRPVMVDTMRRFVVQIGCTLRPGSVRGADLALRSFATFLAEHYTDVTTVTAVKRVHIEDYKPLLALRPGQKTSQLKPNPLAHRLGHLRMWPRTVQRDRAVRRVQLRRRGSSTPGARRHRRRGGSR
jgi:hypothetical protein